MKFFTLYWSVFQVLQYFCFTFMRFIIFWILLHDLLQEIYQVHSHNLLLTQIEYVRRTNRIFVLLKFF